jgi:hypothetical protein
MMDEAPQEGALEDCHQMEAEVEVAMEAETVAEAMEDCPLHLRPHQMVIHQGEAEAERATKINHQVSLIERRVVKNQIS